ncbi:MAG: thermonuclease family protein, partial [Burkholderiales bacterium]
MPAAAGTLRGRVVAVADGDTITVLDAARRRSRVRLAGIDAPESRQPFGAAAKRSLSALVFGADVEVEYRKRDRYGR